MSYVDAGYCVVLASLFAYAASLLARERVARRRLPPAPDKANRSGAS